MKNTAKIFISKIKAYLGNLENLETYENEEADFVVETRFPYLKNQKKKATARSVNFQQIFWILWWM